MYELRFVKETNGVGQSRGPFLPIRLWVVRESVPDRLADETCILDLLPGLLARLLICAVYLKLYCLIVQFVCAELLTAAGARQTGCTSSLAQISNRMI